MDPGVFQLSAVTPATPGKSRLHGEVELDTDLIEELVLEAREVAAATLGDKRKRDVCPDLPLFAKLVDVGMLMADSWNTPGSKGYAALHNIV